MCSANSMEHSYTQLRAGMVGGLNPIPTPPQPMQTSLWKCTPVNLCLLRNCWRACFYVITSESCFMCAEWLAYTLAVQNTLQQLGLHTVHNQSTPLRVEVMTSTHPAHPAFNLFFFPFLRGAAHSLAAECQRSIWGVGKTTETPTAHSGQRF